jgi:hydroxylamine reductase
MAEYNNPNPTMDSLLGLNLALGKVNLQVMEYLDRAHAMNFGVPTPTEVPRAPVEGKCILISGHDMVCMKALLE